MHSKKAVRVPGKKQMFCKRSMSKFALSLLWGGNGRVCGFGLSSVSFWSGPARVARQAGRARGSVGMKVE